MCDAFAERMEELSGGFEMADVKPVFPNREMGEAMGGLDHSPFAGFVAGADPGTAAAGNDKGGSQSFEFEVLQIVVVAAEVEVDAVFF
jgi:hypothetical protein